MKAVALYICFYFAVTWALPNVQNGLPFKNVYVDPIIDELPKDINARITNGKEAIPHSIPYQAYLVILSNGIGGWSCGGSLISPRHVLTAAHCLDDAMGAVVYLGVHNFRQLEDSRVAITSEKLILHNEYNDTSFSNDIGIIVLHEPVEFNENISTVALPPRSADNDYEGENVRVSGWGLVSGNGDPSEVLLEVNSTVISNEQCSRVYDIVIDSQLCISGVGGEGTCNGDSGGPLVAGEVQIGIVSYGAKGCPVGYPSAFTRVTSYLDWIEDNTGLRF